MTIEDKWIEKALERLEVDVKEINECIRQLPEILEKKYLTRVEYKASFVPVRNLIFGLAGTLVGAILIYLLGIKK